MYLAAKSKLGLGSFTPVRKEERAKVIDKIFCLIKSEKGDAYIITMI